MQEEYEGGILMNLDAGLAVAAGTFHPLASHVVPSGSLSYYMTSAEILYAFGRVAYSLFLGPYGIQASSTWLRRTRTPATPSILIYRPVPVRSSSRSPRS
ncbi:MAG: hypothetical protein E4H20_08365 [Spirochaetales bacterium]|nr:MAG: hypothetical protein E4H20_08365 [Spirochaetales bacterium]